MSSRTVVGDDRSAVADWSKDLVDTATTTARATTTKTATAETELMHEISSCRQTLALTVVTEVGQASKQARVLIHVLYTQHRRRETAR